MTEIRNLGVFLIGKENFVLGIDTNDVASWVSACQTSLMLCKKKG
jgi:hypothetical protein